MCLFAREEEEEEEENAKSVQSPSGARESGALRACNAVIRRVIVVIWRRFVRTRDARCCCALFGASRCCCYCCGGGVDAACVLLAICSANTIGTPAITRHMTTVTFQVTDALTHAAGMRARANFSPSALCAMLARSLTCWIISTRLCAPPFRRRFSSSSTNNCKTSSSASSSSSSVGRARPGQASQAGRRASRTLWAAHSFTRTQPRLTSPLSPRSTLHRPTG